MDRAPDLNLALIGNCQIAALVDARAAIVWTCLPRLDGDPVFSALLTRAGAHSGRGVFAVELADLQHSRQAYVPNTAVVETVLQGRESAVRVTDFCPRLRMRGRVYRPAMIVRRLEPLSGRPVVSVRLRPTCSYGAGEPRVSLTSHALRFSDEGQGYRVTTDGSLAAVREERPFVLDRPLTFVLGDDEPLRQEPGALARSLLHRTCGYWEDWVRSLALPVDYQEAVIRAAITLKLCSYEDTGAVLAAITTSIPEAPDSGRNWDYRYCWLRDSWFVVHALNRLGATRTMEAYLQFIDNTHARTPVENLQPLYGITGEADVQEHIVTTLEGYRGMGPVRVGNLACRQAQHDVYGAIILAAAQVFFDQRLRSGGASLFRRLERLGERAAACFALPDAGPWELRESTAVHTFSAVMCWAGCDRLAGIAGRVGEHEPARRWRARADDMRQRILEQAWNARLGAFAGTFGGESLDATALLLAELRFIPADDARFIATVEAIGRALRHGDLLYRYRQADDFGVPVTTFTVCAFWYANALAAIGRMAEARELFASLLARRNHVGLLSEDIGLDGQQWGNFPQTYSMVGIIISALRLSRSWEDVV